jgi:hypothetical protein
VSHPTKYDFPIVAYFAIPYTVHDAVPASSALVSAVAIRCHSSLNGASTPISEKLSSRNFFRCPSFRRAYPVASTPSSARRVQRCPVLTCHPNALQRDNWRR